MKKQILVVDDDAEVRATLAETLRRWGYDVVTAEDGRQALITIDRHRFDLIVTDLELPRLNGIRLLQQLRDRGPEPPVIVITGCGTVEKAVEAMKAGALDFIQKPFPLEVLQEVAASVLGRERKGGLEDRSATVRGEPLIITRNESMKRLVLLVRNVASSQAVVLIQGESGTGKELFARLLHATGARSTGPFVAVNCAAIPENLLESEMFGHERGAFTGAVNQRIGKFELANHGTILLDEISEMALPLQSKLLRVLQEYEISRVGGKKTLKLDVRVVATTNRDLKKEVAEGRFREDLYYRLNVIPVRVPPLRERPEDIPLLGGYFVERACIRNGKPVKELTKAAMDVLISHEWKGNVRELENTIERAVLISMDGPIGPEHLMLSEESLRPFRAVSAGEGVAFQAGDSIRDVEKNMILHTLEKVDGNRTHAAKMLGISIRTLRNKINEYRERGELVDG